MRNPFFSSEIVVKNKAFLTQDKFQVTISNKEAVSG